MSSLSVRTLAAFATVATPIVQNDFTGSERFGELMVKAQAKALKAANEAIVDELAEVATAFANVRIQHAQTIKAFQAEIAMVEEADAALQSAFAYGEGSDNYLPLLAGLGMVDEDDYGSAGVSRAEWERLCTIPKVVAETSEA